MSMTYRDLHQFLQVASDKQLDQNVMVRIGEDEFMGVQPTLGLSHRGDPAGGVLDHGCLYLDIHGGA